MKRLAIIFVSFGLAPAALVGAGLYAASASGSALDVEESLEQAKTELLAANRISGSTGSYRRDNPHEYLRVTAYLAGGERPAEPLTRMGRGLVLVEDVRRAHDEPEPPPTTTEPEPPPPTEPPSGATLIQNGPWVCRGPQNYDLVRITMSNGSADAIQFREDCSGRFGRIEVEGVFADCFKVNPPAPAAHDVVIEGGYCIATGPPAAGVHQDCIQAGGGRDFDIRNFVFDCIGGGGGNYFIAAFNQGAPRRFVCTNCAFGPRHPNQIRTPSDPASGVRDSLVCQSSSGRQTYGPASGNMGGNISPPASDPRCTREGLLAYVGG